MSRLKSILGVALAVAAAVPIARADSVTITPSFNGATTPGGATLYAGADQTQQLPILTTTIGNVTYVYTSLQTGVYSINYSTQGSFTGNNVFGSVSFKPLLAGSLSLPASNVYTPDTSAVWFSNGGTTINNTFGPNGDIVASTGPGPFAGGDPRLTFAQSPAPVGTYRVQWDGLTTSTVKLGDTTNDGVTGQIAFQEASTANNQLGAQQLNADPLAVQFVTALPGDATLDGRTNIDDFFVLQNNYNHTGTSWTTGDFTGDGKTNIDDFFVLQNNYNHVWTTGLTPAAAFGAAQPAEVVPEPASVAALATGVAALAVRRKRSK